MSLCNITNITIKSVTSAENTLTPLKPTASDTCLWVIEACMYIPPPEKTSKFLSKVKQDLNVIKDVTCSRVTCNSCHNPAQRKSIAQVF